MPNTVHKQYTCFIASPSDVRAERDACEAVIDEINRTFSDSHISLRLIRWENDTHPALGDDSQSVINKQLRPDEADFFIGIFWSRFGTPTPRAESGTEEEFNLALNKWEQTKSNHILMFFKTADVPQPIDPKQIEKVYQFKEKVSGKGLYKEFRSVADFSSSLRESLSKELMQGLSFKTTINNADTIMQKLENRQTEALSIFKQDIKWIDRYICDQQKLPNTLADLDDKAVLLDTIVDSPDSFVISAPSQFGLTSAAHHLRLVAWKQGKAWGYVDMDDFPSLEDIGSEIQKDFPDQTIDCIIIDSWNPQKKFAAKVFEALESQFPSIRLIVMRSCPESGMLHAPGIRLKREWKVRELLPMPRQSVREAVASRCLQVAGDENTILAKLLSDMEMMNIPRVPINCWTMLKVAENPTDQSPVNRTQLFDHLLFVLFNLFKAPTYGTLPDADDCNRFLGSFCEKLIRESRISFSRREFIKHCSDYCDRKFIDVNIEVIFDILYENRIIVQTSTYDYRFVASFWIYYFGAKWMECSKEFRDYVLSENRYANYPEIIEFYTGGTRDHGDVLTLLDADLQKTKEIMNARLPFPTGFNPLRHLRWLSSPRQIERMKKQLNEGVSNLPSCIKDQHADKTYNYFRPYDQSIQQYIEKSLFFTYIQQIRSLSKALRNSDHASGEVKARIAQHVLSGWGEIAKVMFALSPVLAQTGQAMWEGYGFFLDDSFDKDKRTVDQIFIKILESCPHNVVRIVKEDISSQRIGKLLYIVEGGLGEFIKHLLMIYLIAERPANWEVHVRSYINSLSGDSFYLVDVFNALGFMLRYEFPSSSDEEIGKQLAKECLGRHESVSVDSIPNKRILPDDDSIKEE